MNRNTFAYKLGKALREPTRIVPYFRRLWRNRDLKSKSADFLDFYSKVVDDMAAVDPDNAVGADDHEAWLRIGKMQFEFLVQHGLLPKHRFLDIGCGNLRAGCLIIEYLDPANYVGVDISARVLHSGLRLLSERGLQQKMPYLFHLRDCDYGFLPAEQFDVAHAHSVFSHLPLPIIRECLAQVRRLLKPGGYFDFTYLPSDKDAYSFCDEDFYYPQSQLLELASEVGFSPEPMEDWIYMQKKIRATKR